jgi:hypothetical protein
MTLFHTFNSYQNHATTTISVFINFMNPENRGNHVLLRHSSLWRKPLLYEKTVTRTQTCHSQLNDSKHRDS